MSEIILKRGPVSELLTSVPFKDMMLAESLSSCTGAAMGSSTFLTLTLTVLFLSCYAQEDTEAPSCPEHQEGFDDSCYEFVGLQRSFLSAQGWCERGGGHLAFILNDETQQFLQKHLDPEKDWWLGLAPAAPNLTLDTTGTEGERACEHCTTSNSFI